MPPKRHVDQNPSVWPRRQGRSHYRKHRSCHAVASGFYEGRRQSFEGHGKYISIIRLHVRQRPPNIRPSSRLRLGGRCDSCDQFPPLAGLHPRAPTGGVRSACPCPCTRSRTEAPVPMGPEYVVSTALLRLPQRRRAEDAGGHSDHLPARRQRCSDGGSCSSSRQYSACCSSIRASTR